VINLHSQWNAQAEKFRPATFKAPLFRSVAECLETGQRRVVLDLCNARGQTIAFLNRYRCRLDIADLGDGLDKLNAETDRGRLADLTESMLPMRRDETTDIVLCWDLLNYLERPALTAVMADVAARSATGTLVHALIVYADSHMPVRPGNYAALDDQQLCELSSYAEERAAPRYSPEDLKKCLAGYVMDHAALLSNGLQEFLFRL
jgi:hypothetical protein